MLPILDLVESGVPIGPVALAGTQGIMPRSTSESCCSSFHPSRLGTASSCPIKRFISYFGLGRCSLRLEAGGTAATLQHECPILLASSTRASRVVRAGKSMKEVNCRSVQVISRLRSFVACFICRNKGPSCLVTKFWRKIVRMEMSLVPACLSMS